MGKCANGQMSKWANRQIGKSANVQMGKWAKVQMCNVQMGKRAMPAWLDAVRTGAIGSRRSHSFVEKSDPGFTCSVGAAQMSIVHKEVSINAAINEPCNAIIACVFRRIFHPFHIKNFLKNQVSLFRYFLKESLLIIRAPKLSK